MISEYVYFGLRPVAVRTGVNINIVHTDYLGSPRIITSGYKGTLFLNESQCNEYNAKM